MRKEIMIESLAYGGEGVGRLDGKVYFVENALPGEKILADVLQDKKSFVRARTAEILTASPARENPPCEYIKTCGGCQYQHMNYTEELKWKENQVRDHLTRQLKISPELILPITGSKDPYHYRTSVTLHEERGRKGFFARDNRSIVEIKDCLLVHPALKPSFQASLPPKSDVTFRMDRSGQTHSSSDKDFFRIQIGDKNIWTHSKCFFQNNLEITAAIAERLRTKLEQIKPPAFADLYSGVGTFSILSADSIKKIICLEDNPYAVEALKKNFQGRPEMEVWEARAEDHFPKALSKISDFQAFLFLDPPRTGTANIITDTLGSTRGLAGIAYLSCHLGTLTRDLQSLLAPGKYTVASVMPFDMFPRTKHIEILTFLEPIE